jgi:2-oxoglutarate ferredoxin oxidoreductase subunit alpha
MEIPESRELPPILVNFKTQLGDHEEKLQPYSRDEKLARPWAVPGTPGLSIVLAGWKNKM